MALIPPNIPHKQGSLTSYSEAKLSSAPDKPKENQLEHSNVTYGDMHGNASLFIHRLWKTGCIENVTKNDIGTLDTIYEFYGDCLEKKNGIAALLLEKKFSESLDKMSYVNSGKGKIRPLGDLLADRGYSDVFILKIIQKISSSGIPLTILYSNHDQSFMLKYENPKSPISVRPCNSYYPFEQFFESNKIEARKLVEIYKKHLKLIDYSVKKNKEGKISELRVFTHAPVTFDWIDRMAQKCIKNYKPFNRNNPEELTRTIDKINEIFTMWLNFGVLEDHQCTMSCIENGYLKGQDIAYNKCTAHPETEAIWNRIIPSLEYCQETYGKLPYSIKFIFGHVGEFEDHEEEAINLDKNPFLSCLDSDFGKRGTISVKKGIDVQRTSSAHLLSSTTEEEQLSTESDNQTVGTGGTSDDEVEYGDDEETFTDEQVSQKIKETLEDIKNTLSKE